MSTVEREGRESGYHDRARARETAALIEEVQRAGACIAGKIYVWVTNPYGKLSLRRTGVGVPGVFR